MVEEGSGAINGDRDLTWGGEYNIKMIYYRIVHLKRM